MKQGCPGPEMLSRLIDDEFDDLDPTAPEELRGHAATCPHCRDALRALGRAEDLRRAAVGRAAPATRAGPDCLSTAELLALADEEPAEGAARHLESCDACLSEAQALVRARAMLDRATAPVPPALAARVASRWRDHVDDSAATLAIRIARRGLEILRREVVAPLLDLEILESPAPALRAPDEAVRTPVRFRLQASAGSIEATVFPEGDAVRLELLVHDASGAPLAGQRVHLRQKDRSLFSARTGDDGSVHLPRIEPGAYEVTCSGIETSFRLDLHA